MSKQAIYHSQSLQRCKEMCSQGKMRLFWYRIMISYLQINHLIQVFYIENLKEISRLYCLKIKTSFSMLNHIKGMKRLIENVRCEQAPTALTCADNKREGHWIFVYRIIVGHANLCIYYQYLIILQGYFSYNFPLYQTLQ